MYNKTILILFLFVIILQAKPKGPNILHIFTDDQSYRTVGAYPESHSWVKTPNIDRLAEEGVRFTHAYIGSKCVPSRASTLTGLLQISLTEATGYWASNFKDLGYYTGMVGKWHWRAGVRFDTTWNWAVVWEHHLNNSGYYVDQPVRVNNGKEVVLSYSTDGYTDYAVEFINDRAKSDSSWYLWLCYAAVHGPYTPADRHKGDYSGKEVKIPVDIYKDGPGRSDKPEFFNTFNWWTPNANGVPERKSETIHSWSQTYNEGVLAIDEGVGRIRAALESSGQLDNTVIIFTSDQGYAWGQHGWMGKRLPHDASIRGPLIIYQPNNIIGNKVLTEPVNGPDVIQTIHSLAGITPAEPLYGRDLKGIITGQDSTLKDNVMLQVYTGNIYGDNDMLTNLKNKNWTDLIFEDKFGAESWLMIIEDGFKYIRYLGPNTVEEIYDLNTDPDELVNLAVDPDYQAKLFSLRSSFIKELERNEASFVDELPDPKLLYTPVTITEKNKNLNPPLKFSIIKNDLRILNNIVPLMNIIIYDIQGKEVFNKKSKGSLIPLEGLSSGSFYLSIRVEDTQLVYKKIDIK